MEHEITLGRWAMLDIETTGISADDHHIIDIGYLLFEEEKLIKKYSSTVFTEFQISHFLQKLTGITPKMISSSPPWSQVKQELMDLNGATVIAHNAAFEHQFLSSHFSKLGIKTHLSPVRHKGELLTFWDSIFYLALLSPNQSSLSLEAFILNCKLADKEEHRGFADSRDLLKVILVLTFWARSHCPRNLQDCFKDIFQNLLTSHNDWFARFFFIGENRLLAIADQLEFNLQEASEKFHKEFYCSPMASMSDKASDDQASKASKVSLGSFSADSLDKMFAKFADVGLEKRSGQLELAKRVGQSFKNNIHAMVQAPTGTGKTLSYLLTAALFALTDKSQKVIVSAGTKALQTQMMETDLQKLKELLGQVGQSFQTVRLIGTQNHFCELAYRQLSREFSSEQVAEADYTEQFFRAYFEIVFCWNKYFPYEQFIEFDNLPFILSKLLPHWNSYVSQVRLEAKSCLGARCPHEKGCSYREGIKKSRQAQLLLVNHALYLNWPQSIDAAEYVILDEAHLLPMYIDDVVQKQFSSLKTEHILKQLQASGLGSLYFLLEPETYQKLKPKVDLFVSKLIESFHPLEPLAKKYFMEQSHYQPIFWNEISRLDRAWTNDSTLVLFINTLEQFTSSLTQLLKLLEPFYDEYASKDLASDLSENEQLAFHRFQTIYMQLYQVYDSVHVFLKSDSGQVQALKYLESEGLQLVTTPIDLSQSAKELIYREKKSVVFTSATLTTMNAKFGQQLSEWETGYQHLDHSRRFGQPLALPPIFDYEKRVCVLLVTDMPDMKSEYFIPAVIENLLPPLKEQPCKSLFLFSANARFELARELLLQTCQDSMPVLSQGMGKTVVEDFKKLDQGILIGREAFAQGIDLPGNHASFVYIDKIPDLPYDLVSKARRNFFQQHYSNEFEQYFLVSRARLLSQKLGRLMRTPTDSGVVVISDSRVAKWKSATRRTFWQMLEPYQVEEISREQLLPRLSQELKKNLSIKNKQA